MKQTEQSTTSQSSQRFIAVWFGSWAIAMLLLVSSFIQYAWLTPLSAQAESSSFAQVDNQVLTEANRVRQLNGLSMLQQDSSLSQAAAAKAKDMLQAGYFAHYYNQKTPWQFIDATGYTNWHYAGENLAKNYTDAESMVEAWLNSPTHRDNLLSSKYDRTGIATVSGVNENGEAVTLTVQLFTGS